jgi:hypothetical protein
MAQSESNTVYPSSEIIRRDKGMKYSSRLKASVLERIHP